MALTSDIKGVVPIAPTPFHEDERIDERSLDRLIDFYAGAEVDGLTILSQLGEAGKLDHAEGVAIARRVVDRTRLPVIVGVSPRGRSLRCPNDSLARRGRDRRRPVLVGSCRPGRPITPT